MPEPEVALRPVLVFPLEGDSTDYFKTRLETVIDNDPSGDFVVVKPSTLDRTMDQLFREFGLKRDQSPEPDALMAMGKRAGADYIIFGNLERMKFAENGADIAAHVCIASTGDDKVILEKQFLTAPAEPEHNEAMEIDSSGEKMIARFLVMLLFIAVWPLACIPAIRRVLEAENNGWTLVAILGLTAVSISGMWVIVRPDPAQIGVLSIWCSSLVIAVVWNLWVVAHLASKSIYS